MSKDDEYIAELEAKVDALTAENQGLRCLVDDEILKLFDSTDDTDEASLKQEVKGETED